MVTRDPKHLVLLIMLAASLVFSFEICRRYKPYTFIVYDDGWQVEALRSVIFDRDLDLRNQLGGDPKEASDQIALGKNGEWYCVHEFLLPFVTIPLYLLLDLNGCLFTNLLLMLLAARSTFRILIADVRPAAAVAAGVLVSFNVAPFAYSYSLDVLGAALLLAAFERAIARKWDAAGFLFGLAVLGRLPNGIALPAFLFLLRRESRAEILRFFVTALPGGVILLIANTIMFGGPLELSYFHNAFIVGGKLEVISQSSKFGHDPISGLRSILFDPTHGFFSEFPVLAIGALVGVPLWLRRSRRTAAASGLLSLLLIGLYSTYSGAIEFGGGMRHFLPVVFLASVPFGHAVDCLISLWKAKVS